LYKVLEPKKIIKAL